MSDRRKRAKDAIVLLHGFMGSGGDWSEVISCLGASDRVLIPDLPGHGRATGLIPPAYTMDGAADGLIRLLDRQQIQRASFVGYSMGGRLALHAALRHPDRVRQLVLISASPGLESESEREARRKLDARRAEAIQADLPSFLENWYQMPLFSTLDDRTRQQLVGQRSGNVPVELVKSLRGMGTGVQPSHWEQLHMIDVPACAIAGAHDPKFVSIARRMAETSSFRARIMPDVGHAILAENPQDLAVLLQELLSIRQQSSN
ncbi:MAG: 2-succinyl-6-hydroxy-2,4-cyclohexadiene-1-carboxylate synthase [Rubricoccaceae bacterium]|nr:2-succinyl-6-hydroxy-2,4-cyclohexadiene-1-carboxylate synthase [Rubricoccaceae bacterium]